MPASERRSQLVAVARRVFAEKGYYGASMDEIASAAGITKPILYQHFDSKLDLYLALIDEASLEIAKAVWEATSQLPSGWQTTLEGFRAYFHYVNENSEAFRIAFADAQSNAEIRDRIDAIRSLMAERVSQLIVNSPEGEWASQRQIDIGATAIVGMAEMVARRWVDTDRVGVEEAALTAAELTWSGISGFGAGVTGTPEKPRGFEIP